MKYRKLFAAALAMLMLAGCAENPDSGIIVHKDMEKVISEAENSSEGKVGLAEMQQTPTEHYETEISAEKLNVKAKVSADVTIPDVEQLSVLRVKQHEFTQEEVDKVRKALLGDAEIYDGVSMSQDTKAELESLIADARAGLDEATAGVPQNESEEHDREQMMQEWQGRLDELQKQYEAAPDEPPKIISDGKLQNPAEMLKKGENKSYWEWQNDLGCKETVELRNADNTAVLYAQNNPNYSNKISFRTSPVGTVEYGGVSVGIDPLNAETRADIADPFINHKAYLQGVQVTQMPGDSCTLTREQAEEQAQAFLQQIGQTDFTCFAGGKYAEYLLTGDDAHRYYRTCWILRYCRAISGVPLRQDSGEKEDFGSGGGQYTKRLWTGEIIELHISDAGIVWLDWNAPLDIVETVVGNAAMKPFSEIKSTFERMLPVVKASEHGAVHLDIDSIRLSYSRISEKDSFDTGLVVPVWGFSGTYALGDYDTDASYGVQLAINAIDGSVIDAELGY